MQFLKNHYEKVLLSVVLLILVGAAVVLTIQVNQEHGKLATIEAGLQQTTNVPVQFRPLEPYLATVAKATNPPAIDFSGQHLLFNPVRWVLQPDGKIIKVDSDNKLGIGAIEITNIKVLNYTISFDKVSGSPESPRYQLGVERQGAADARDRRKKSFFVSAGGKSTQFVYGETNVTATVKEVKGTPAEPTDLVLELSINGEDGQPKTITAGPNHPYTEVMAHTVDLKYPPENKTFLNQRVGGEALQLGMESYKIIAITEKQVTFESVRNQKRTVIKYGAAP